MYIHLYHLYTHFFRTSVALNGRYTGAMTGVFSTKLKLALHCLGTRESAPVGSVWTFMLALSSAIMDDHHSRL